MKTHQKKHGMKKTKARSSKQKARKFSNNNNGLYMLETFGKGDLKEEYDTEFCQATGKGVSRFQHDPLPPGEPPSFPGEPVVPEPGIPETPAPGIEPGPEPELPPIQPPQEE